MPNRPGWCLASMGNYLFTSKFLVRELLKGANDGATDFGKHIIPRLYKEYPVYVYDFNTNIVRGEKASTKGYWRDVGTLDAFFEANMDLCSENPPFDLYNNYWPIRTYNWNQPPARFFAGDNESHQGAAVDSIVRSRRFHRFCRLHYRWRYGCEEYSFAGCYHPEGRTRRRIHPLPERDDWPGCQGTPRNR